MPTRYGIHGVLAALVGAIALGMPAADAAIVRVSVSSDGAQGDAAGEEPAISADGRYLAFYSKASNLVADDTNDDGDVFVYDRRTGKTVRISVSSEGNEGKGQSRHPSVSADGRYIAFDSSAPELVADDTNGKTDVFVHDRETGETARVSVSSEGEQGDKASKKPTISTDGRYVAFYSKASNLVKGDTNDANDVFVHDRETGATARVSVASDGAEGDANSTTCAISADGRYVAFQCDAGNLVDGDTNRKTDIMVHDRETGDTVRASVASDGSEGDDVSLSPAISADGRYVLFQSGAGNLVAGDTNGQCDIFRHDLKTGETTRVSVAADGTQADGESRQAAVGADGRFVAFQSRATNLVADDSNGCKDLFVRDLETDKVTMVSMVGGEKPAAGDSSQAAISGDGRCIAFRSSASDLVAGDTNGKSDIFVWEDEEPPVDP